MKLLPLTGRIELAEAQMLRLADAVPVWIACAEGALWISQAAEPRDIVIEAGEGLAIKKPQDAIIGPVSGAATMICAPFDGYRVAA